MRDRLGHSFPRRAAVSKGLLIVLVVAALGAIVYWGFLRREEEVGNVASEVTMYCPECGEVKVPTSELSKLPFETATRVQCYKCKKMIASSMKRSDVAGKAAP